MEPANPFQAFLIKLDSLNPPRRLQPIGSVFQALVHTFWKSTEKWHVGGWPVLIQQELSSWVLGMADHGQPPPTRVPTRTLERPCVRTQRESDSCRYEKEMRPREGSPVPEATQQFSGTAGA